VAASAKRTALENVRMDGQLPVQEGELVDLIGVADGRAERH